ncbi:CD44 antigen isoform X8 [Ciconia boyciana]|uniref:CD44 antigen isoform X8 n=1 Tax=Ciconia boyciana TaxID=52775 RepID=UPI003B9E62BC
MVTFSLRATFGLCLLKLCLTETQFNVSCRYGGVFHVEKNGRYSLTRSEAVELCRALNSTLSTLEQLKKAHELGFETCRYGFVVGNIVIPRINPYHLCAANHTGIYKLSANTTGRYDAYCYNATETRDKACEPIGRLDDTSFLNNQGEIVIDNTDDSRYNAHGTRHSGESSTSDDENVGSGSTHDTTPMDTSIRRSSPSYYGTATPVSQLPDHSSGGGEKEIPRKDSDDEVSPVSTDISLMTAADRSPEKDGGQYPASTTPGPHHDNLEKATTQAQWNPFSNDWWWSHPGGKMQEPTQATKDVTSSGNGSDDEDSSEETTYPTVFPGWDRSVAKDEYAPSTSKELPFSLDGFFLLLPVLPGIPSPLLHIYRVKIGCSPDQLLFQTDLPCYRKRLLDLVRSVSLEAPSSIASRIDVLSPFTSDLWASLVACCVSRNNSSLEGVSSLYTSGTIIFVCMPIPIWLA